VPVTIIEPACLDSAGRCRVLFALHGFGGRHNDWIENARLDDYVAGLPVVTILPTGDGAFYIDGDEGAWETYIARDLVAYVDAHYPTVRSGKARATMGLSMGGWGALSLALRNPDIFCAGASHSGPLRFNRAADWDVSIRLFGEGDAGQRRRDAHDLAARTRAFLAPPENGGNPRYSGPAIYFDCGASDFLFDTNRGFADSLREAGVPYEYHEYPGAHDWFYWDLHARDSIRFLARAMGI
jgi:S-formylglutathione hydrolase FrmB